MKNKWFVGLCVLLVFGFALSGCDTGTGGGVGTGKKLTITDLPDEAVGKYVAASLSLGNGKVGWAGRAIGHVNTSNIGDNTFMGAIVSASKQVTLNVYTHIQGNVIPYTGNEKTDADDIRIYYEDNEECLLNDLYPKGRAEEDADFADGDVTVTYYAEMY